MKELVSHLLKCNLDQILEKSLLHCHLPFMHSIMLLESPGKTIRLFVKDPHCTLDYNSKHWIETHQTLAFHSHHCDLTLVPTRGEVVNILADIRPMDDPGVSTVIGEYRYSSQITGKGIGFEKLGTAKIRFYENEIAVGKSLHLKANEIHSVSSPVGEWAAWFALEGNEDPNYDNRCWSFSDLDKQSFDGLYRKMDKDMLMMLLRQANLL